MAVDNTSHKEGLMWNQQHQLVQSTYDQSTHDSSATRFSLSPFSFDTPSSGLTIHFPMDLVTMSHLEPPFSSLVPFLPLYLNRSYLVLII
jgi:hypothetical protein